MDIWSYVLVGVGLAMDCVAVSFVGGISARKRNAPLGGTAVSFALTFGFFQGGMTVAGYFAGSVFEKWLQAFGPWIAFALLAFVGGKMLYEAFQDDGGEESAPVGTRALLAAGVATSIDALAVGVSYALIAPSIWLPSALIGVVTAALCVPAIYLGAQLGKAFSKQAEIAGGLILIGIGLRILIGYFA